MKQASGQAKKPSSHLKNFGKLVGTWKISGPEIEGEVAFEWFDGEFFLVQRGWLTIWGRKIVFVEYIGYDEERQACVSHLFDNHGDFFTYVWEINVDQITIWFGRKDSDNLFKGKFAIDGNSYSGNWKWPGGGYQATLVRLV